MNQDWQNHFELWSRYEDIAMHFNQLLITLRTQALGGVAAAVAIIVGLLAHRDSQSNKRRKEDDESKDHAKTLAQRESHQASANWGPVTCVFFALALFWLALAVL